MSSSALFVHVPVDKMEIVSARVTSSKLFYFMGLTDPEKQLSIAVTLHTKASEEFFQRKLVLTRVSGAWLTGLRGRLSHYTFDGDFGGKDVRGQFYVAKGGKVTGEFFGI